MEVRLPYGKEHLTVEVPDENLMAVAYTRVAELRPVEDVHEEVVRWLRSPIGTPPLAEMVGKGDKVAIVVDDYTRACPDHLLLPPILEELQRGGVRKEDITIVVATGLHPPLPEKLEEIVGKQVLEEYEVVYHDAKESEMVDLGQTTYGVPVRLNKIVADADFKMSTGFIEPHVFAGFSGGRKSIMPGISSAESIFKNHGYSMLINPNARPGVLRGNPVHEDALQHMLKLGHNFVVNVILTMDKQVAKVVAGHPVKAWEEGVRMDRELVTVRLPQKADVVITTNSGYPLDIDLYQTCKGARMAADVVKRGGHIIIASKCWGGVGPGKFYDIFKEASTPDEVLEKIRREEPIEGQWCCQIWAMLQKEYKIHVISDLEKSVVEDCLLMPADTVEEAVEEALRVLGPKAKIAVIPEGPVALAETRE